MKRAINFRFDNQTITTLALLEERLHASRTSIVEEAIAHYAREKLKQRAQYMKYAGSLSEEEGEAMLKDIKASRKNKKFKTNL